MLPKQIQLKLKPRKPKCLAGILRLQLKIKELKIVTNLKKMLKAVKDTIAQVLVLRIIKEIKLALQDVGRKLGGYIRKNVRAKEQKEKFDLLKSYSEELASSISSITGKDKNKIFNDLLKGVEGFYKELKHKGTINKNEE